MNSTNAELAGCRGACTVNAQCTTGCCLPFTASTNGFCAPASYCTCGEAGASCGSTDPACCDTAQCTVIGTAPAQCLQKCTVATDCASNCCIPVTGTGVSVCADASNCG